MDLVEARCVTSLPWLCMRLDQLADDLVLYVHWIRAALTGVGQAASVIFRLGA
jgi:hypothetical protein